MKKTKIIIPAMGMLLLGTAASVTGTVAWFSANNKVTISGMSARTQVKGNLLIASSNADDTGYTADNYNQAVSGILEPVSSINGIDFFYTKENVSGTGATTDATLETYSTQGAFATYYGVTGSDAYVDYTFYLKATSDKANQVVAITKFNMLYNGSNLGSEKAWRAAVFVQEVDAGASAAALAQGQLKTIVAPNSASYFTTGKAYKTATTATGKDSVLHLSANADIGTIVTKGTTQRYYVAVRLFLEGEDTTCKNDTFANLTEDYSLNLVCELLDSGNGANEIISKRAATISKEGTTASVVKDSSANGLNENLTAYQWQLKNNTGVFVNIENANANSYEGSADDVVRCLVTTAESGVYPTAPITL